MAKQRQAPAVPPQAMPAPHGTENKPVHELRHRRIRATIWKNETASGPMYTVTVSRMFKQGETWKDSRSFGYDDILVVAKLMYDAHSYLSERRAKEHDGARASLPGARHGQTPAN